MRLFMFVQEKHSHEVKGLKEEARSVVTKDIARQYEKQLAQLTLQLENKTQALIITEEKLKVET